MKVKLGQAALARWPQMQVDGLIVRDLDIAALAAFTLAWPDDGFDWVPLLERWKQFYRAWPGDKKARCSLAYLAKAAQAGKLRSILPLVDLYNQASLLSRSPFGGEDLAKLGGELSLDLAAGDEPFLPLGKADVEHPQAGEAVWLSGGEAVCRCLNWLESDRFKLDEGSRSVVFVSEQPDGAFPSGAAGMDWLAEKLAPHAGAWRRFRLDAASPAYQD
ncbi:B3/4 domain-containing protein [Chromobacterium sp. IIBBL 290-4]|uniref:B3/B4 domain-containing protein n=1 Tax=Chromobacterium sp. IIBBL 290-4 TaxID=2953890 RepID=UPI0020B6D0B5|nr:phenylalanine--tRNA ligase beta subunit-related protein [Chromobacterium sp. IIBBL 290-4]UTH75926.1 phenylalanine--tRNA ligase beta subunit-related protein [Chromobacterium sp. IIBBL 290-4]